MKRFIFNLVLIILAFVVQNSIFPYVTFLSAVPNLLLILTFSFGFIRGKKAGMFYGALAGLILDLFYTGPIGFYMLIFIWIGYLNGICNKYYYEEYITLPLVLSVCNELAYSMYIYIFSFLLKNRLDFGYYVMNIMVPEIICTVVATLLFYRLFLLFNRQLERLGQRRGTRIV